VKECEVKAQVKAKNSKTAYHESMLARMRLDGSFSTPREKQNNVYNMVP
jgi:hypothetical protein